MQRATGEQEAGAQAATDARTKVSATAPVSSGLIQAGVALVAALVAVLYPIGYTLLVARLGIAYTHSLTTAWYAASLVPVPNVLGQVFGLPFLLAVGTTAVVLVVEQLPRPPWRGRLSRRVKLIVSGIALLVIVVASVVTHDFAFIVGIGTGMATATGSLLLNDLWKGRRISALTRLGALASLLYIALTAISLLPPTDQASVLPQIELSGVRLGGTRLLAHTDGYWYVFTSDGALHAIPDSQAGPATIGP
jgi:hypothetical protein